MYEGFHPRATDVAGDAAQPVIGSEKQRLGDRLHGEHYEDTLRGRVFSIATTPLGLAIPIYTATAVAGAPTLANPSGSGVNFEIIEYGAAWASGTAAFAAIGLMVRGYTTTTLSTITEEAPYNGLAGGGKATKAIVAASGTITVTAGVAADMKRVVGNMNLEANSGTAHATVPGVLYNPRGSMILPPGTFCYPAATKASVALFAQHLVWKEVPR